MRNASTMLREARLWEERADELMAWAADFAKEAALAGESVALADPLTKAMLCAASLRGTMRQLVESYPEVGEPNHRKEHKTK